MDFKDYNSLHNHLDNFWHKARISLIRELFCHSFSDSGVKREVLDIGCGTGYEVDLLQEFGRLTVLDKNINALKKITQPKVRVLHQDAVTYVRKKKYDCICAFDLLEHIENDALLLKNIFISLKPGGVFLFTVPAFKFLYSTHDIALEHCQRYNKNELKEMLVNSGFQIEKLGFWNSILFPMVMIGRLVKKLVYMYFVRKKIFYTDMNNSYSLINKFLFKVLTLEVNLIRKNINFPFGLTIYGIVRKSKEHEK